MHRSTCFVSTINSQRSNAASCVVRNPQTTMFMHFVSALIITAFNVSCLNFPLCIKKHRRMPDKKCLNFSVAIVEIQIDK